MIQHVSTVTVGHLQGACKNKLPEDGRQLRSKCVGH